MIEAKIIADSIGAKRSLKSVCKRGHDMSDAHITRTVRGLKRTCRKCRYIRHKTYLAKDRAEYK